MQTLTSDDRRFLRCIGTLSYCNPFSPARIDLERQALGSAFDMDEATWNTKVAATDAVGNIARLLERAEPLVAREREELRRRSSHDQSELGHYADSALFVLYHRYRDELAHFVATQLSSPARRPRPPMYDRFRSDVAYFFDLAALSCDPQYAADHLFALAFQLARAFHHIYQYLVGISRPMQELRSRVWQSIFSVDLHRYRRTLYQRMGDISTLITGPSGSGKELVARAVGLSRYIPFDSAAGSFSEDFAVSFLPLNIAALPATLIESELFGHRKGAFTGAVSDRKGWLEQSGPLGTVFLDEIAEVDTTIQAKLLRVLESREFQRMGETTSRAFPGKLIAATNRDLHREIGAEKFRLDLYYRLCADHIETPSLRTRVQAEPKELDTLVHFLSCRLLPEGDAAGFAAQAIRWIRSELGEDYPWAGNVRELEQCLRNLMIQGRYRPISSRVGEASHGMWDRIQKVEVTVEEFISWYCVFAYAQEGNYQEVGRKLGLDRRTVKAQVAKRGELRGER